MALRFTDSCDAYAATADLLTKWATNTADTNITFQSTGGRFGGGCIQFATSGFLHSGPIRTSYDTSGTGQLVFGFSFYCNDTPSSAGNILYVVNSLNDFQASNPQSWRLYLSTSGVLSMSVWQRTGPTVNGTTNICDGNWHWIEVRFNATSSTAGNFQISVDGSAEISMTTWDGNNTNINQVDRFSFQALSSCTYKIDDLIVYDNLAGTLTGDLTASNYPLGDHKIDLIRPDGAGSSTDFSPSTGSNYTCVDETVPNGDTDYIQSTTSGHDDLYTFGALPDTPASILGVVVNVYAKNTDAGANTIKGKTKSSASTAVGTAVALGASYKTTQFILPRDPNTSAAWAGAAVDAAEFGVELV